MTKKKKADFSLFHEHVRACVIRSPLPRACTRICDIMDAGRQCEQKPSVLDTCTTPRPCNNTSYRGTFVRACVVRVHFLMRPANNVVYPPCLYFNRYITGTRSFVQLFFQSIGGWIAVEDPSAAFASPRATCSSRPYLAAPHPSPCFCFLYVSFVSFSDPVLWLKDFRAIHVSIKGSIADFDRKYKKTIVINVYLKKLLLL